MYVRMDVENVTWTKRHQQTHCARGKPTAPRSHRAHPPADSAYLLSLSSLCSIEQSRSPSRPLYRKCRTFFPKRFSTVPQAVCQAASSWCGRACACVDADARDDPMDHPLDPFRGGAGRGQKIMIASSHQGAEEIPQISEVIRHYHRLVIPAVPRLHL